MGKDKLKRFSENATFPNLIQPKHEEVFHLDHQLKGKWHQSVFGNHNPIVIELGCGKGEYTVELAKRFPEKNFIGIDIKGARLWRGAKNCLEQNIINARFVRTRIEFITSLFASNEVSEIWIVFPDPQIKSRRALKRLTSSRFLNAYSTFLTIQGIIHLKTDSYLLYQYTLEVIKKNNLKICINTPSVYQSDYADLTYGIITFYEKMFLTKAMPICYLQFQLSAIKEYIEPNEE